MYYSKHPTLTNHDFLYRIKLFFVNLSIIYARFIAVSDYFIKI